MSSYKKDWRPGYTINFDAFYRPRGINRDSVVLGQRAKCRAGAGIGARLTKGGDDAEKAVDAFGVPILDFLFLNGEWDCPNQPFNFKKDWS